MTHCGWLSDRIPAVVLGRAEWTPQETQHLQECRACQEEWEVVSAASRLGRHNEAVIDTEAVAASVLERLGEEQAAPYVRRKPWVAAGLAAAAAIVIAVWGGGGDPAGTTRQSGPLAAAQLKIPLPELENLEAAELDTVLQVIDEPNSLRELSEDEPELSDLTSEELQRVLDTWEG
jgi:hypothetical protein